MSIQLKRSLASAINQNHILLDGQIGIEKPNNINSESFPYKFKIGDGSSKWSALPYAAAPMSHTHSQYLTSSDTVQYASQLATSRTIQTNLGDTTPSSFNGTANITPGVKGTLPITNGGTGATTASGALSNLGAASSSHTHSDYLSTYGGIISGDLTITGDLRLKGMGNYGNRIHLGDGDYVYFYEETDDVLTIKANQIKFVTTDTTSSGFTLNGSAVGGGSTELPDKIFRLKFAMTSTGVLSIVDRVLVFQNNASSPTIQLLVNGVPWRMDYMGVYTTGYRTINLTLSDSSQYKYTMSTTSLAALTTRTLLPAYISASDPAYDYSIAVGHEYWFLIFLAS